MGLNGLFMLSKADDQTRAEGVGMIGTADVPHIFHTEHGELEVMLSFTGDEGVNATGVVGPSMHFAHGGNALIVKFEEAFLAIEFLHSNHAAGGHILDAHCNEKT